MELWTEYEGKTIDGAFPLKKLVSPQGRSAFFSTANGKGEPILIRLVACHFDEEEILTRWRGVQALNHPNFLRLERYGQLELDDTRVVYAAFEHTDANLAQVLAQGCLTAADGRQLAANLASALEMLHANGFVHEHVTAESIFAVGEMVKLRTDCIREAPEGAEGLAAKRSDVRDLAAVVLQALTQERTLETAAARHRALPAPFDELVQKGISAEWGLSEIAAVLRAPATSARARSAPKPGPAAASSTLSNTFSAASESAASSNRATHSAPASSAKSAAHEAKEDDFTPAALRSQILPDAWRDDSDLKKKWIGAGVAAVIVLFLLWAGWSGFYRHRAAQAEAASHTTPPAPRTVHHSPPAVTAQHVSAAPPVVGPAREIWRVVAYTYNHQDQAQKKSAGLAQRHPELRPAVFSPTGRAPFLVTIGGAMDRDQAYALARRSHGMGLPRDTYAQNYRSAR